MGIVVESTSTATGSTPNVTITKPTGLAVGDLLIAVLSAEDDTPQTPTWNTLSGWSSAQGGNYDSRVAFSIQYKVATAGDVAASNFTFAMSTSAMTTIRGSLLRCSGAPVTAQSFTSAITNNLAAASFSFSDTFTSYTPQEDGALVIMQIGGRGGGATQITVAGYNTVTTGITFTELYDVGITTTDPVGGKVVIASAYGVQGTAAALSQYSATYTASSSVEDHFGQIVVFSPIVDATGTNTLATATASALAQTGTCDTNGTNTFVTATGVTLPQTGRGEVPTQWTNETKPSTTWTNET